MSIETKELNEKVSSSQLESNLLSEEKKKKIWDSWTREEKILFYEAIANGSSSRGLQKLFKYMNSKIGTKSTEKIRDYYYRANKQVSHLLKNVSNLNINFKDKKEALCVLKCYGTLVMAEKDKKTSKLENLNKHPRLLKKVAGHLKKMVSSKLKLIRSNKNKKIFSTEDKKQDPPKRDSSKFTFSQLTQEKTVEKVEKQVKSVNLERRDIKFERFALRIIPFNNESYCKVIQNKSSPRLELVVPYNKSLLSIHNFISEKYLTNSHSQLVLYPIKELWQNNETNSFCFNQVGIEYINTFNLNYKVNNRKNFDIHDLWLGYGRPNSNLIYLLYEIFTINSSSDYLNINSLLANPTKTEDKPEGKSDEGFEFDPLDFLGLYDNDNKDSLSVSEETIKHETVLDFSLLKTIKHSLNEMKVCKNEEFSLGTGTDVNRSHPKKRLPFIKIETPNKVGDKQKQNKEDKLNSKRRLSPSPNQKENLQQFLSFNEGDTLGYNNIWLDENSLFKQSKIGYTNFFQNDYLRTKDFNNSINFNTNINNYNIFNHNQTQNKDDINYSKEFRKIK